MTGSSTERERSTRIVDVHTHFVPQPLFEFIGEGTARQFGEVTRAPGGMYELRPRGWSMAVPGTDQVYRFGPKHYSWEARIAHMDRLGLRTQVVSGLQSFNFVWADPGAAEEVVRLTNDDMARASSAHPGRIHGIASLPLQDVGRSLDELERAVVDLGLRGVQMLSNINGRNLDHPELFPLYARIEQLRVPIFIHPYGSLNEDRLRDNFLSNVVGFPTESCVAAAAIVLGGVLDRFPGLRFLLGHGGGSFVFLMGRIEKGHDVMGTLGMHRIERSPREYITSFSVDTLTHSDVALSFLLESLGDRRVVLGTDWPLWMEDTAAVERIDRVAGNRPGAKHRVASGNADALFGLADPG